MRGFRSAALLATLLLVCSVQAKRVPSIGTAKVLDVKRRSDTSVVAATDVPDDVVGTSSVSSSIFNLAKTILGAGTLSIPAGVAGFSDKGTALFPASAMVITLGLLSAYSFSSIGTACKTHNVKSYAKAWAKSTDKPKSAIAVSSLITFKTFFACLAYSIIIGDSFSSIFRSLGAPAAATGRTNCIVVITTVILFPLCCLRNLDALKYTSIMGLVGTIYCAGFMGLRLFDGSYSEGGKYFEQIAAELRPSFDVAASKGANGVFMFMSMMATAFMAHYNAPKFMSELKEATVSNFNTVTSAAFGFSILTYVIVMIVGFLTFGGHSTGFILNNYASTDGLATLARIAIGGGVLFGYPLTFSALRDGVFDMTGLDSKNLFYPVTIALLAIITQVALKVHDVGAVLSFSGALIGSLLIFIIPAIMNICNTKRELALAVKGTGNSGVAGVTVDTKRAKAIIAFNYLMATFGVAVAVIGVSANLASGGKGGGH